MVGRNILMGERCEEYSNKEVYTEEYTEVYKIDAIGEFEYEEINPCEKQFIDDMGCYVEPITSNASSETRGNIKFIDVYRNLERYCKEIREYGLANFCGFIVVDKELNRVGGDHCIRIANRTDKYTINLEKIVDSEVGNECDLLDYGVAQCKGYEDSDTHKMYRISSVRVHCTSRMDNKYISGNMVDAWVEDGKLMVALRDRRVPWECGDFRFNEYSDTIGLNSVIYRIKCVNDVVGIPIINKYGRECYYAGTDRNGVTSIIDKEAMDRAMSYIRYVAIDETNYGDEEINCYDFQSQSIAKVDKEDVARLLEFGELVYTLESVCLDADNEANKFEYIPIGEGKFINSKGDIVTHQEMEEYFMEKYGYFIDLYNTYRLVKGAVSIREEIIDIRYGDFDNDTSYWIKSLKKCKKSYLSEIGVVGDKYTEVVNLKIKNGLLYDNAPTWVTIENMRGNSIEIRNKKLIQCEVISSLTIRDVESIDCSIQKRGSGDVTVIILGNIKVSDWCVAVNEGTGGEFRVVTDNADVFNTINSTSVYWSSLNLEYTGGANTEVIRCILTYVWATPEKFIPMVTNHSWCLSYEDTYTVVTSFITEMDNMYSANNRSCTDNLVEFIYKCRAMGKDINIDIDAIEDIIKDYTEQ